MRQFLVSHGLLETTSLLPEETLPSGEVSTLKQCVLQDTLNTTQSLNHIGSVIVEVPQLTIVSLVSPPERILLQDLELFEILSHSPTFVVGQS